MIEQQRSKSDALFGFIFIAGVFVVTFLLVRGTTISSAPEVVVTPLPVSEINILYLADESKIPIGSNRQPSKLFPDLSTNIQVVNEGDIATTALDPTTLKDLDVLIVDQSALTFINPEDITNAYDASVVVFGLNIPVKQFSILIDDSRVLEDNFAADPYLGDYFIYTFQSVTGQNPDEVARVDQAGRTGSDEAVPGITGQVSSQFSRGQNNLESEQDLRIFTAVLTNRASDRP